MKYVITGGAGHVSKPLTEKLLAAGHEVTVITRNAENIKELTDKGAQAAVGSVEDINFLTQTFSGADAVYTMIPPQYGADIKLYDKIGKNYAAAIKAAGVKYVVNLSSIGAHLPEGCGPVSGLYLVEKELNSLQDVHVKHLRPGFFFVNFLGNVGMVKHMNIIGGNYGEKMVLSDPKDIAEAAANELIHLNFKDHSVRYLSSDERTTTDIAKVLGSAVDKPELPWVEFSDEQTLAALQQAGFPESLAKNYTEMGAAMRSGKMWEDYWKNHPADSGETKLENFSNTFAAVYKAS